MGLFSWIKEHVVDPVVNTVKAIVKNPVALLVAVGVGIVNPALGLRMLATMAVSNIFGSFTKKPDSATDGQQAQQGNPTVLQPNTQNKLPFVYGRAVFSPAIVDAKISSDNQTMWYCLALCEAPDQGESTIAINNVYIDGKTCVFDTDHVSVKQFILEALNADGSHQTDDKVKNKIQIHFYRGNPSTNATPLVTDDVSAMSLMRDSSIAENARWTGTEYMADTIFMIVKLTYDQDAGITSLGNLVVDISNNQNGIDDGYKPGSAMLDYLTNSRYGAGLSLDMVDAASFADLDAYADEIITFTAEDGNGATQPRYRFNGMVDTTQVIMNNLLSMADSCDAFIQYNEAKGRWAAIANKAYDQAPNQLSKNQLFVLDDNNIMGGVNVTPLDLNSTPNMVQSSYSNWKIKGQITDVYAHTPQRLLNKLEPINQLTMKYQFVNDSVRAQYLSNRKLEQVRADYIVDLVADYSAIQVDAGDVVLLTYQPYGARDYHITGITSDSTAKTITVTFDSSDAHPFEAGGRIGISDCKPASFNGSYIIQSATTSTVTLSADNTDTLEVGGTIYSGLSWSNKPFRVLQVNENRGDDGTLTVKLHMNEYSDQVYDNFTIQAFTPPGKNYLMDAGIIGKPDAPTIPPADIKPADTVPTFKVAATTPATGVTMALEFWYSTSDAIDPVLNNYKLYDTQYNSSSNLYGQSQPEQTTVSGLEAGTYYWRVRAVGTARKSEFSDSVEIVWAPVAGESNLGDHKGASEESKLQPVPFYDTGNWTTKTRGIMPAGVTVIAQSAPGSISVNFSTAIYANSASDANYNCIEVWKSTSHDVFSQRLLNISHSYNITGDSSFTTQVIQAVGTGRGDYVSYDGGLTWGNDTSHSSGDVYDAQTDNVTFKSALAFYTKYASNPTFYRTYAVTSAQGAPSNNNNVVNCGERVYNGNPAPAPLWLYRNVETYKTNFSSSLNGVCIMPGTGVEYNTWENGHNDSRGSISVGNNGLIIVNRNYSSSTTDLAYPFQPMIHGTLTTADNYIEGDANGNPNTLNHLNGVYSGMYDDFTSKTFVSIIVGDKGTILKSTRAGAVNSTGTKISSATWIPKTTTDFDGSALINNLRAISGDNRPNNAINVWVAVGDKGTIVSSNDNGDTWTRRECLDTSGAQILTNLTGVRYGNGYWIACGEGGVILQSTDGAVWTQIQADLTPRNLYSVDWSPVHHTFNISGDALILNSRDDTISFNATLINPPDESYTLERVWYRGSFANPKWTGDLGLSSNGTPLGGNAVPTGSRLLNGQTVSSTFIDTKYSKTDEISYYLVIGNLKGATVYVDAPVITATEYKK